MKRNVFFVLLAVLSFSTSCSTGKEDRLELNGDLGTIMAEVRIADGSTRADVVYEEALDVEKVVKKMDILVFDVGTRMLNASKSFDTFAATFDMTISAGSKVIYVLVNGPDVSSVTEMSQVNTLADSLSVSDITEDGLAMFGHTTCVVKAGEKVCPEISVKRLVSRVVLKSVTSRIPKQYGNLKMECVYLGNAYTVQNLSGNVFDMVNKKGYDSELSGEPIGKEDVEGRCPSYMFRKSNDEIAPGGFSDMTYYLYCQPNPSLDYTCLYMLVSIGGIKYYYRVPLNKPLAANTTCSVEVVIANLGSTTPPDGDFQKGEIQATVKISDWVVGNSFVAEF